MSSDFDKNATLQARLGEALAACAVMREALEAMIYKHPDRSKSVVIDHRGVSVEVLCQRALASTAGRDELERRQKAEAALVKINEIRNSIIGTQSLNWSEHIYPLVAALEAAGVRGKPYPEGKAYYGQLMERLSAAEARVAELVALLTELLNHDEKKYGSWTSSMVRRVRCALDGKEPT